MSALTLKMGDVFSVKKQKFSKYYSIIIQPISVVQNSIYAKLGLTKRTFSIKKFS